MFPCLKPKLALYLRCPSSLSASIPASTHTTLIFLLPTSNLPCPGTPPYPQGVSLSIPSDKFSLLQLSQSLETHTLEVGRAIICCLELRSCQGCTTRCLLEVTCTRSSPLPLELWVPPTWLWGNSLHTLQEWYSGELVEWPRPSQCLYTKWISRGKSAQGRADSRNLGPSLSL